MSIKAIFYSKFDPQQGPVVAHQVPEDAILLTTDLSSSITSVTPITPPITPNALLSFPAISRFLIPRQSLCGNLLTLSPPPLHPFFSPTPSPHPPHLSHFPRYHRNEFIYTFTLLLDPSSSIPTYSVVLRKITSLITSLEEQSLFLSSDTAEPNSGKIYSLMEMVMEDLNNYAECMIPIDDLNTLNIKLFPALPSPPKIEAWHVPLFLVRIETLIDDNWDLTMQRIIPLINGVNSIKRISVLADADLKLTRKCVRHLVYYGCVLLLDIFSFNAIYAPTAEFTSLITSNEAMQQECARYCNTKFSERTVLPAEEAVVIMDDRRAEEDVWPLMSDGSAIDGVAIVQLFASLRQGLTVREWFALNSDMLANIDVRRFVTFGVIKGFLYRVHRYAVRSSKIKKVKDEGGEKKGRRNKKNIRRGSDSEEETLVEKLVPFLDGTHCFDAICTELEVSERELIQVLESRELGRCLSFAGETPDAERRK